MRKKFLPRLKNNMAYPQNALSTSGVTGITGGWTGQYQNTYGYGSIRVSWLSDQNSTVNVKQGGTIATTMFTDSTPAVANVAKTTLVQVYDTYANVNISFASTPTVFNLETFFFPSSSSPSIPIQTIQLTSATGTVTFNNIPQTGSKLSFYGSIGSSHTTIDNINITINGDTTLSYTWQEVYGVGGVVGAFGIGDTKMRMLVCGGNHFGPLFSTFSLEYANYANALITKAGIATCGAFPSSTGQPYILIFAGWLNKFPPITSIVMKMEVGNFIVGSIINMQII